MKNTLKTLAIAAFALPILLFSNQDKERHLFGGGSALPQTFAATENEPLSKPPSPPQESQLKEEEEVESSGFIFDRFPQIYFTNSFHYLYNVDLQGNTVEFIDGTVWKIGKYDSYKANNWRATDDLFITQNNRWFTSYTYRIINKNTGGSVEANCFLGPIKNGEFTYYIDSINHTNGILILLGRFQDEFGRTKGSTWEICPSDLSTVMEWEPNQPVLIGVNSGWQQNYEGILINVSKNNFVRAKQY